MTVPHQSAQVSRQSISHELKLHSLYEQCQILTLVSWLSVSQQASSCHVFLYNVHSTSAGITKRRSLFMIGLFQRPMNDSVEDTQQKLLGNWPVLLLISPQNLRACARYRSTPVSLQSSAVGLYRRPEFRYCQLGTLTCCKTTNFSQRNAVHTVRTPQPAGMRVIECPSADSSPTLSETAQLLFPTALTSSHYAFVLISSLTS